MKILLAVLAMAFTAQAQQLPDEGKINCDHKEYMIRIAFDIEDQKVWWVRLNENGQPEIRLPYELRVAPFSFVSAERTGECDNCYRVRFKMNQSDTRELLAVLMYIPRDSLAVNLFDLVIPEKPEQTWTEVGCWTK